MRIFLASAFVSLFAISCSNDTKTAPAGSSPDSTGKETTAASKATDACALITADDAKSILGEKVKPGMQTASMCQYVSGSEELMKSAESVSLTLHTNAGSEFDKYVADTESSMGIKTEPVSGAGEKAAWADGSLIVKKGSDLLILIVGVKADKEKHIDMAKSLANRIISRM